MCYPHFLYQDGDLQLTPFERKNGADYNPLEEEFVSESDIHGNVREYIQKHQEGSKLLNHRDDTYTASDIVNVTREMTAQIRALKRQEMEHDRQIYDPNTQDGDLQRTTRWCHG